MKPSNVGQSDAEQPKAEQLSTRISHKVMVNTIIAQAELNELDLEEIIDDLMAALDKASSCMRYKVSTFKAGVEQAMLDTAMAQFCELAEEMNRPTLDTLIANTVTPEELKRRVPTLIHDSGWKDVIMTKAEMLVLATYVLVSVSLAYLLLAPFGTMPMPMSSVYLSHKSVASCHIGAVPS